MSLSQNSKILASDVKGAIKGISRSGTTFTYTCLDGTTGTFTQQDNNTTYSNMTAATASAAGKAGLVPAPAKGYQTRFLRGDATWQTIAGTDAKAYITATWVSGTSWYRKWSDGWIEQGGRTASLSDATTTVTFPLSMSNTNYHAGVSGWNATARNTVKVTAGTTTTMTVYCFAINGSGSGEINWFVAGY